MSFRRKQHSSHFHHRDGVVSGAEGGEGDDGGRGGGEPSLVLGRRPAIVSQDSVTIVLLLVLLYLPSRSDDLRHWRPRQQHREPQITVMTNQVIIIMKFADTFTSSLVLRSMVAVADDLGCPGFWQLIAFEPRPCS